MSVCPFACLSLTRSLYYKYQILYLTYLKKSEKRSTCVTRPQKTKSLKFNNKPPEYVPTKRAWKNTNRILKLHSKRIGSKQCQCQSITGKNRLYNSTGRQTDRRTDGQTDIWIDAKQNFQPNGRTERRSLHSLIWELVVW